MNSSRLQIAAPVVLRIGISLVFLWFGFQQILNTEMWTRLIPEWVLGMTGFAATSLVHFNGAFEIVFGICLLLGIQTRIVSFLLALHMLHIMVTVGYNAIGVRDFGLAMATIAIFLNGIDCCTLDWKWAKKTQITQV